MKKTIYILTLALLPILAKSQITGIVYGREINKTETLVGANIYWANTTVGVTSDNSGKFSINKPDNYNQLVFQFTGYIHDTLTVNHDNQYIEITLKPTTLEEVTVTERQVGTHYSRMEIKSVQNISEAELGKAACCNLSESFETNASVDASYSDATTGAKQIRLLGLAGKYVQMMTENIPNLYGLSQPYALGYIPGPWMESIQVSKGTSAVINGYDAITGQINVEYKKPATSDLLFVNLLGNSAGATEANIDGSIMLNQNWSTTLFAHSRFDFMKLDANSDNFLDMPMVNQYNFFNRWDYFGNNLTWRFGAKYIDEERMGGQKDFDFDKSVEEQTLYGIHIKSRRYEAFSKLGYVNPNKIYQSVALIANITRHNQNSYYGKTLFDATQTSIYGNLIWQSQFAENHQYHAGASLKFEDLDQLLNNSTLDNREVVPGIYFQYTGHFNDQLHIILGGRADHHNKAGFLFTPRVNLKYDITPSLILRSSVGKGYRHANVLVENNFLLASSRKITIADNLKLEDAWNFGTNLTYTFLIGNREMAVNAEFYRTHFANQIIADFETPTTVKFYNLDGKSYSNTYQIEATWQLFRGFDLTTAFRYNDVKQTIDNKLVESPLTSRYKGIATVSYRTPLDKWQFDFTAQFNGGGRIPETDTNPNELQLKKEFPAYNIFNAQITKYFKKWEMYAGVENIFNFTQSNPIIAAYDPFGSHFDSSLIWGPIHGQKFFVGIRFAIQQNQ